MHRSYGNTDFYDFQFFPISFTWRLWKVYSEIQYLYKLWEEIFHLLVSRFRISTGNPIWNSSRGLSEVYSKTKYLYMFWNKNFIWWFHIHRFSSNPMENCCYIYLTFINIINVNMRSHMYTPKLSSYIIFDNSFSPSSGFRYSLLPDTFLRQSWDVFLSKFCQ